MLSMHTLHKRCVQFVCLLFESESCNRHNVFCLRSQSGCTKLGYCTPSGQNTRNTAQCDQFVSSSECLQ